MADTTLQWHRVAGLDELPEGRVVTVTAGGESIAYPVWQTALINPDFARFAESCGALGIRVTDTAHLDEALGNALSHDGPSLVEVITDPDLV
jgi:thiamine pyrophosphate-dependent acetolactate synthase large subunit-like protein